MVESSFSSSSWDNVWDEAGGGDQNETEFGSSSGSADGWQDEEQDVYSPEPEPEPPEPEPEPEVPEPEPPEPEPEPPCENGAACAESSSTSSVVQCLLDAIAVVRTADAYHRLRIPTGDGH